MRNAQLKNQALMKLGAKIQRARKDMELTLDDVAAKSLSAGNLSEIENGKRDPRFTTLCTISKQIGISLRELIDGL
jgi:transcriptional regulator with XRE-family HTH domain